MVGTRIITKSTENRFAHVCRKKCKGSGILGT